MVAKLSIAYANLEKANEAVSENTKITNLFKAIKNPHMKIMSVITNLESMEDLTFDVAVQRLTFDIGQLYPKQDYSARRVVAGVEGGDRGRGGGGG